MSAALSNTPFTAAERIGRDHPYWSASYGCVCDAVDREMALRAEVSRLREALAEETEDAAQWLREEGIERKRAEAAEAEVSRLQQALQETQNRIAVQDARLAHLAELAEAWTHE
jgi:hypothetical protein